MIWSIENLILKCKKANLAILSIKKLFEKWAKVRPVFQAGLTAQSVVPLS
jgi:hypothetical protein